MIRLNRMPLRRAVFTFVATMAALVTGGVGPAVAAAADPEGERTILQTPAGNLSGVAHLLG